MVSHQPGPRVAGRCARLDQFFNRSQHGILVEPVVAHIHVGPRQHLQLTGVHHLSHIYACRREPPQIVFPLLHFNNVGRPFSTVEAIFEERAKHPVLLVEVVEESTNVLMPAETAIGTPHGTVIRCHVSSSCLDVHASDPNVQTSSKRMVSSLTVRRLPKGSSKSSHFTSATTTMQIT